MPTCVALQPGIDMATACLKPGYLDASTRPRLNVTGYTCASLLS